jgi:hypothetical protein
MEQTVPVEQQAPQEEPAEIEGGLHEGMKGIDQTDAPAARTQQQEKEDIVDLLVPKAEVKEWTIGKGDYARKYVQRPLSFIGKMQWFSLVGEVLDKAMSGDDRLSVNSLLSAPQGRDGSLSVADFRDADTFVQAIGKLLVHAPDFLLKSYCIWLSVPDFERDVAMRIMALPPEDGGLTDDQGMEIIERFIDQNYEALDSFFREKIGQLQRRVQARAKAATESRQSKP